MAPSFSLAVVGFLTSLSGAAQELSDSARSAFNDAYAAYSAAVESGDAEALLSSARESYEAGSEYFGRIDANTAALAMNYGNALASTGTRDAQAASLFREADQIYAELSGPVSMERVEALLALASVEATHDEKLTSVEAALRIHRTLVPDDPIAHARVQSYGGQLLAAAQRGSDKARALLTEALTALEEEFGKSSLELLPTLFSLGVATAGAGSPDRRQTGYFDRAVEITRANAPDSPEAVADIELRIAAQLVAQRNGYRDAMPFAASALATFSDVYGDDHPQTAMANLAVGRAFLGEDDADQAVTYIENAVDFYAGWPDYHDELVQALSIPGTAFVVRGDDDGFTESLIEAGRRSPTAFQDEPVSLVKVATPGVSTRVIFELVN